MATRKRILRPRQRRGAPVLGPPGSDQMLPGAETVATTGEVSGAAVPGVVKPIGSIPQKAKKDLKTRDSGHP